MSWFQAFFSGFFTRHVVTKLLALSLSIGLFLFVQSSLTGTQEIAKFDVVPTLAEDTRGTYVLVTGAFSVNNLTIRGELSKVEALARTYRNASLRLPIDGRILSVGKKQPDGLIEVPLDANFLRDEVLQARDVTVELTAKVAPVKLCALEDRAGRIAVATELTSLSHADYEGSLVFVPNYRSISVRGPSVAFPPDKDKELRLVVGVRGNINDRISANPFTGESGILSFGDGLCEIRWPDSNVKSEYKDFLRITPDGGTSMTAAELQRALTVSCTAVKKKEAVQLKEVPIVVLYGLPRTIDLDKWQVYPPFTDQNLSDGELAFLDVRMPAVLKDDEAFKKNLVVVFDVAAATEDKGVLKVPYYLDLKDRTRDEDVGKLAQVAIAQDPKHVEFRRKS